MKYEQFSHQLYVLIKDFYSEYTMLLEKTDIIILESIFTICYQ